MTDILHHLLLFPLEDALGFAVLGPFVGGRDCGTESGCAMFKAHGLGSGELRREAFHVAQAVLELAK